MQMLTAEELRKLLEYDHKTGVFVFKFQRGSKKAGEIAGTINKKGYRYISIHSKLYRANRLAWLYMTGEWPKNQIDHKNMIKDDDRWENLREADNSHNHANVGLRKDNKTGYKGVRKANRRWAVEVANQYIGTFETVEEAYAAYKRRAIELYGEFART